MFDAFGSLRSRAEAAERKGKVDKAMALYRELVVKEPKNEELWLLLADKELALAKDPLASAEATFRAGDIMAMQGKLEQALGVLQRALSVHPSHGGARRVASILERRLARGKRPASESIPPARTSLPPQAAQAHEEPPLIAATPPPVTTSPPVTPPPQATAKPAIAEPVRPPEAQPSKPPVMAPTPVIGFSPGPATSSAMTKGGPATPPPITPVELPRTLSVSGTSLPGRTASLPEADPIPVREPTVIVSPSVAEDAPVSLKPVAVREVVELPRDPGLPGTPPRPRDASKVETQDKDQKDPKEQKGTLRPSPGTSLPGGVAPKPPAPGDVSSPLADLVLADRLRVQAVDQALEIIIDERPFDFLSMQGNGAQARGQKLSPLASPFLAELDNALLQSLVEMASVLHVRSGEIIFRQGDKGDLLYVILKGEVDVLREQPDLAPRLLARLRAGTFFGEMALLTNEPRSATVQAAEDGELLAVSRAQVHSLVQANTDFLLLLLRFFRARLIGTLIQTSPIFKGLSLLERRDLIARFRLMEVPAGTVLIEEGRMSENFSIVVAGRLLVHRALPSSTERETLGALTQGNVFGEMSLLTRQPAIATVAAESKAWILALPKKDFESTILRRPTVKSLLERLARERRQANEAIASGRAPYSEGRIDSL